MRIKKTFQGSLPDNKIVNTYNTNPLNAYGCAYINTLLMFDYSTTEKRIGTWINGKPLYRKTITASFSGNGQYDISVSNLSPDILWIGPESFLLAYSGTITKPLNVYENANYNIRTEYNVPASHEKRLTIWHQGDAYYNGTAYLSLYYTKTTD